MEAVKRTERGWAGHYICSDRCTFRRNTLLEYNNKKVVVSTVGAMVVDCGFQQIGCDRYFETKAFLSKNDDAPYYDADIEKELELDCKCSLKEIRFQSDLKANEMHENAVKWVEEQLIADKLTYYYDE